MSQLTVSRELKTSLLSRSEDLKQTLPAHIPPKKFINTAMLAWNGSEHVQRACMAPEGRKSFFSSVMRCAQDGLLPDGREAALVAYKNTVQYMPMVAGLQKAMRNSGQVVSISAHVVYENDKFHYRMGDVESIEHEPAPLNAEPGKPIGAYCIIQLKDGGVIREVLRMSEIKKVQSVSRAKKGPWFEWFEEMAKKTAIRRAYKRAPSSADVDQMLNSDNENYDLDSAEKSSTHRAAEVLDRITDIENIPDASDEIVTTEQGVDHEYGKGQGQPPQHGQQPYTGAPAGQQSQGGESQPVTADSLADMASSAASADELMTVQDLARSLDDVAERNAVAVIIGQRFKYLKQEIS